MVMFKILAKPLDKGNSAKRKKVISGTYKQSMVILHAVDF